jgi:NAD(P)-dependent dehydrogenase (short-subunit alcohol dehydrogenase family)
MSDTTWNLSGKTAIVTGANVGIGKETARALAAAGAKVVMACRDQVKAAAALAEIRAAHPTADVEVHGLDLGSLASVRDFVSRFVAQNNALHVLVNNAGLFVRERSETVDGFETTTGVNHLGPFLLTNLLLDTMKKSAPARIVNVSSTMHLSGKTEFDDRHWKLRKFDGMKAYADSKLMNVLFTDSLALKLASANITANSCHPGFVSTDIYRGLPGFVQTVIGWIALTPVQGAQTSIFLATAQAVEGKSGDYYVKSKVSKKHKACADSAQRDRLWDLSAADVKL